MTQLLTVGVIGKSSKENEKRLAIHPEHIKGIPQRLRKQITFEEGYGLRFGMNDNTLAELTSGRVACREEILNGFDCVVMPKPLAKDLSTQVSIERKLTLIAWEEMFTWSRTDEKNMHIFYKNNEMAGYAGVNHALSLTGVNGYYGKSLKTVVLSFGSVSRGALYALQGQGFRDITVYTGRPSTEVRDQLPGISFKQMKTDGSGNMIVVESDSSTRPFAEALSDVQIIVNGTLQDTAQPMMQIN